MNGDNIKSEQSQTSSLDSLFVHYIGTFGKFQKRLILYITLVIGPLIGFNLTTQLLILLIPPHLCEESTNALNLSNNFNNSINSSYPDVIANGLSFSPCRLTVVLDEVKRNTTFQFKCPHKRQYDHSIVYPTLVSEVCCTHYQIGWLPALLFYTHALSLSSYYLSSWSQLSTYVTHLYLWCC